MQLFTSAHFFHAQSDWMAVVYLRALFVLKYIEKEFDASDGQRV